MPIAFVIATLVQIALVVAVAFAAVAHEPRRRLATWLGAFFFFATVYAGGVPGVTFSNRLIALVLIIACGGAAYLYRYNQTHG
ncbi:hypothetical protein ACUH88_01920 [Dermabacteraceae bacterium P13095]